MGADTTASGNRSQELITQCKNLYATGILFAFGFFTHLRCAMSCPDLLGRRRENILDSQIFLDIPYIIVKSPLNLR